jgi:hypothetical protein
MASWTDNSIPKFNPYVQQLPVEAMVQVGMHKQKQYEDGIQKIQTNIDNIAGLDVMRDIDKTYLQSKLNELGNNLKTVAAGDFSNFQLVNSVNGMTTQISKDKNVQTAVGATAWYRKQAAEMEKAITEGKASQANIYDFNTKAGQWLNSDKLDEGFNGRYTQYTDVKKKALEAIKGLHPKMQQYDIPFEVDGNGNINTKKIADAMIRHKIEGIDENQIQQAVYASMTPDDLNQMKIDSNYQFRGIGSEQLLEVAQKNYDSSLKDAVSSIETLKGLRATTTDPTKLTQIEERISKYEDAIGKDGVPGTLSEELNANIENAINNPDEVKYSLYKSGFIKEFGNAFSWKNETKEYLKNPFKEQENFVAEMRHKQQVENRHRYEFGVNSQFKQQDLALKREENFLKAQENAMKKAELYGVQSPWTPVGNPTDNELMGSQYFSDHLDSVSNEINSANGQLLKAGYSQDRIYAMYNEFEKNQGVANIPAKVIGVLETMSKNKNYLKTLESFQKQQMEAAKMEAAKDPESQAARKAVYRDIPGMTLTFGKEKIVLSPEEVVGVIRAQQSGGATTKEDFFAGKTNKKNIAGLNKNQLIVFNSRAGQKYIAENADKYRKGILADNKYDRTDEFYNKNLAKYSNVFVPQIKAVVNPKGEVPPVVLSNLNQLVVAANRKGISANKDFNINTASDYLSAKNVKDTKVFVQQTGENYEIHIQNLANPGAPQVLTVGPNDIASYVGADYVNSNSQASARMALGGGTTDIKKKNIAQEAIFQKSFGNFPNIRKLKITANLEEDLSNPDALIPTIYLQNKSGKYTAFELSGYDKLSRVDYDSAKKNLENLTDDMTLKVLKQYYPNFDFTTIQQ